MRIPVWFAAGMLMLLAACTPAKQTASEISPMRMSDTAIQTGERLYNTYCYKCHAMGTGGLGFSLNDKPLPRFAIRLQIRHGLGYMPAFSEEVLSDQQVEEIIDYVIAMRHHDIEK
jgi:mono/diheme cytochrome c family protein